VRVSNLSSSSENQKLQADNDLQKGSENDGKLFEKHIGSAKLTTKSANSSVHRLSSNANSQFETSVQNEGMKLQLYENDLKVSFVSDNTL
jgi:hypothetical protein